MRALASAPARFTIPSLMPWPYLREFYSAWIDWFGDLETPIKAAVTSSLFTLLSTLVAFFGVLSTIGWYRRKHQEDAELALRKDCYLTISDTVAEVTMALAGLLLPHVSPEGALLALQKFAGAAGKIMTIGNREVRSLVADFQIVVATLHVQIMARRNRLNHLAEQKAHLKESINLLERIGELYRQHPEKFPHESRAGNLQELRQTQGQMGAISAEQQKVFDEGQELSSKELVEKLTPAFAGIVVAMRTDLRLAPDADWFEENARLRVEKAKALLAENKQLTASATVSS